MDATNPNATPGCCPASEGVITWEKEQPKTHNGGKKYDPDVDGKLPDREGWAVITGVGYHYDDAFAEYANAFFCPFCGAKLIDWRTGEYFIDTKKPS